MEIHINPYVDIIIIDIEYLHCSKDGVANLSIITIWKTTEYAIPKYSIVA